MSVSIKRKPSLYLEDYEKNVLVPHEEKHVKQPVKGEQFKSKLTLDDLDMIALNTEFDKQMMLGYPMYMDDVDIRNGNHQSIGKALDENELHFNMFDKNNNSVAADSSTTFVEYNVNDIDSDMKFSKNDQDSLKSQIKNIKNNRMKYLKASLQDNQLDCKYDVNNWLMYPKPLPKFWRLDRDKRFQNFRNQQNEIDPDFDIQHETNYAAEYGCYSDSNKSNGDFNEDDDDNDYDDDENKEEANFNDGIKYDLDFFQFTLPVDKKTKKHIVNPTKKLGDISYTGEYFNMRNYENALKEYNSKFNVNDFHIKDIAYLDKISDIPSFTEFSSDFFEIVESLQDRISNVIAEKRLVYLNNKFDLFQHLNQKKEIQENKEVPYRDFYNCRKVDRNFSLSGCVQQKQLCDFIWDKINKEPKRIVYLDQKTNKKYKLIDIFQFGSEKMLNPSAIGFKVINDEFLEWYKDFYLKNYHIIPNSNFNENNIETLPNLSPKHLKFYLIAITFLEYNNFMNGEYLAEIFIKYVIHYLELNKYLLAEVTVDFQFYDIKVSMDKNKNPLDYYCQVNNWWTKFSNWIARWNLVSNNVRWNVNIPRIYPRLYELQMVSNFREYLDYIFKPLFFEWNVNSNINFQYFLSTFTALDLSICNSDSYIWKEFTNINTLPKDWSSQGDNPPVAYYMYYMYQSLAKFNIMRNMKKQNSASLRNSSSTLRNRTSQFGTELYFSEHLECLASNILLCNGGLLTSHPVWTASPLMQYLYYLFQVPLIASPLSSVSLTENSLLTISDFDDDINTSHIKKRDITLTEASCYSKNPYLKLFQMGMKVSLSCKSILFNSSYTREPLMEEYSVAASIYLLNAADLCELARNSVICSGFDGWYKRHWLGVTNSRNLYEGDNIGIANCWYDINGPYGHRGTSMRHNVPFIRRRYRNVTLAQEWSYINDQL